MSAPPRRRSLRAEREFGLLVGAIALALGSWWLYRGRFPTVAPWLAGAGGLLALLGLFLPRALRIPYQLWMGLAERISRVVTFLVLSIVWFLVLTPIGLAKRAFGWDPLGRRAAPAESYWRPAPPSRRNPRHYEKMF